MSSQPEHSQPIVKLLSMSGLQVWEFIRLNCMFALKPLFM